MINSKSKKMSSMRLINCINLFLFQPSAGPKFAFPFSPRVDLDAAFPVLPVHPLDVVARSGTPQKPWLLGTTKDEAQSFYWGDYKLQLRIITQIADIV